MHFRSWGLARGILVKGLAHRGKRLFNYSDSLIDLFFSHIKRGHQSQNFLVSTVNQQPILNAFLDNVSACYAQLNPDHQP